MLQSIVSDYSEVLGWNGTSRAKKSDHNFPCYGKHIFATHYICVQEKSETDFFKIF